MQNATRSTARVFLPGGTKKRNLQKTQLLQGMSRPQEGPLEPRQAMLCSLDERHPKESRRSDVGRLQALLRDQQETVRNTTLCLWPLVNRGYEIHPHGKVWDENAEGVLLEYGDVHGNSRLPSPPSFTAPYQCVPAALTLPVQSQSQSKRSARGGRV